MMRRPVELALWIVAIALAVLAGMRGRAAAFDLSHSAAATPWQAFDAPSSVLAPRSDALVAASEALVARDPFRVDRKPSGVPYSPTMEAGQPAPPRAPRPVLAVSGIIGGPPWEALVEGVPGRQGSMLVRRGDTLSGLRIRSITKDTVKVTGMDTTWTLTVRRAWQ